jgi:hypothetical protein
MADEQPATDIASTWDKLENWKRWLLVLPIEATVCLLVLGMAYQGQAKDALVIVMAVFSAMIGYYFGSQNPQNPQIPK